MPRQGTKEGGVHAGTLQAKLKCLEEERFKQQGEEMPFAMTRSRSTPLPEEGLGLDRLGAPFTDRSTNPLERLNDLDEAEAQEEPQGRMQKPEGSVSIAATSETFRTASNHMGLPSNPSSSRGVEFDLGIKLGNPTSERSAKVFKQAQILSPLPSPRAEPERLPTSKQGQGGTPLQGLHRFRAPEREGRPPKLESFDRRLGRQPNAIVEASVYLSSFVQTCIYNECNSLLAGISNGLSYTDELPDYSRSCIGRLQVTK